MFFVLFQFDENIRILLGRYDLDQDLGEFLTERKALSIPEPEPDSDSNSERKDIERGDHHFGLSPPPFILPSLISLYFWGSKTDTK